MTALSFVWVHPYSQNSGCDTKILYSSKCTSGSNFILSFLQNERGFHGIVFGKRTISK